MPNIWSRNVQTPRTDFEIPPQGMRPAILVGMIDLGTHAEEFDDKKTGKSKMKDMRKVFFVWELTANRMTGSKFNHVIGQKYSMSSYNTSKIMKLFASYLGKPVKDGDNLNFGDLLGKPFLVNIKHTTVDDRTFANFDSAAPPPENYPVPPPLYTPIIWDIDSTDPLPTWLPFDYGKSIASVIADSHERRGRLKQVDGKRLDGSDVEDDQSSSSFTETDDAEIPF